MKFNIIKYLLCYWIEKQHRFVFDNIYFAYEDPRFKTMTLYFYYRLIIYKAVFPLIPDFREYLKYWSNKLKTGYIRYNNYWRQ